MDEQRTYTVYVRETVEFAVEVNATDAGAAGEEAVGLLMEGHGRGQVEWADIEVAGVKIGEADTLDITSIYDWNQTGDSGLPGKKQYIIRDNHTNERLACADTATRALAQAEDKLAHV